MFRAFFFSGFHRKTAPRVGFRNLSLRPWVHNDFNRKLKNLHPLQNRNLK